MGGTKILSGDTWLYHPEHEPVLVTWEEAEELKKQGWVDTPAKFKNKENTDSAAIPTPSFEDMTKVEIDEYGKEVGIELDRRKTKANMIKDLTEFLDGNS